MKRLFSSAFFILSLALRSTAAAEAASPAPAPVADDALAAAREHMNQGAGHFAKGDWEAARASFLEAWALKKHPAISSNLAEVEMKLGRYRDAAEHLKFSLEALPSSAEEERDLARGQLAECRAHLSVIRLSVNVAGATVEVDGESAGAAPLADELWLDPGQHMITVAHPGYVSASRPASLKPGEARTLEFVLEPASKTADKRVAAALTADTGSAKPKTDPRTWTLLGGGVLTAVAVGAGTVFLLKAEKSKDDAAALRADIRTVIPQGSDPYPCASEQTRPSSCGDLRQAVDEKDQMRTLGTVSFVAAGVIGAATVTSYLLWPSRASSDSPRGAARTAAWVGPEAGGVTFSGEF